MTCEDDGCNTCEETDITINMIGIITLIEDKPLESLNLDEFGRGRLAELMANSISDVCASDHNCVVYGIYGK